MLRSPSIALALALFAAPAWAEPPAQAAAEAWLGEVDAGDYAKAWGEADPLLQSVITQASLAAALSGVRGPLGALQSRRLASSEAASTLPGSPDGSYRILAFSSRFAEKADATETVVMRQEPDGWKVSGYHLR